MMSNEPLTRIRVVLADDQVLFREALHNLIAAQPDIDVVGEAGDGEQALRLVAELRPDVVLMDVQMPVLDGVAATRRIKDEQPECHTILLTTFDDDEYVFEGLRAGAIGYLLKDVSAQRLIEAIHIAARGETFLQPSITAKVVAELNRQAPSISSQKGVTEPLTPREVDILRMI